MPLPSHILKTFSDAKILVTGGTGLIGRQVVDILTAANARVANRSLTGSRSTTRRACVGDLTSFEFCRARCEMLTVSSTSPVFRHGPDVFDKDGQHSSRRFMLNANVLEAARLSGVKKLVYTSSIGAYEDRACCRERIPHREHAHGLLQAGAKADGGLADPWHIGYISD